MDLHASRTHSDGPEQSKRFIDIARAVEAAETEEEAERAFKKVAKEKLVKAKPKSP